MATETVLLRGIFLSRLRWAVGFVLSALMLSIVAALGVDQAQGAPLAEAEPGEVQTEPAEATANGFKLLGKLNPEGSPTTYYFVYKDTGAECEDRLGCGPMTAVGGPLNGDTQQEVAPIEVTGLDPGMTYRYWIVASNANRAVRGPELTFTTPAGAAPGEVQTEPAEATANGFKLRGKLNPEGSSTTYYFVYKDGGVECENEFGCGPVTAEGGPLGGDTQQEVAPIEVTGLDPGMTYRYWLIARNANGMARGAELTFIAGGSPVGEGGSTANTALTDPKLEAPLSPLGGVASPAANSGAGAPSPSGVTSTAPKHQKLSHALRACKKKPRSRRVACERQARKKYGVAAKKSRSR